MSQNQPLLHPDVDKDIRGGLDVYSRNHGGGDNDFPAVQIVNMEANDDLFVNGGEGLIKMGTINTDTSKVYPQKEPKAVTHNQPAIDLNSEQERKKMAAQKL